jgi:hypothetical protein
MKRIIFSIILATGLLPLYSAQDGGLKFESDVYDFGDIDQGDKVTTTFKFKNTSSVPVEILNVATSCGCTTAKPEKPVYQPGEGGEIPVTFNSTRFSGKITKRITVTTNDNNKQVVTIKGNVVVDIITKPTALFFAKAESSKQETLPIQVSTNKLDKLEITNLATEPEYLKAELKMDGDKNATITVTADGNKFPTGKTRLNGLVTFDTNSTTQPNVKINVTINVERPIRTSPNAVYFFATKPGQERTMNVRLLSTKGDGFKLGDIKSDVSYIKVNVKEDESATKELVVTLDKTAPAGKFMTHITIATDMVGQKEIVIPVRGSVLDP